MNATTSTALILMMAFIKAATQKESLKIAEQLWLHPSGDTKMNDENTNYGKSFLSLCLVHLKQSDRVDLITTSPEDKELL